MGQQGDWRFASLHASINIKRDGLAHDNLNYLDITPHVLA